MSSGKLAAYPVFVLIPVDEKFLKRVPKVDVIAIHQTRQTSRVRNRRHTPVNFKGTEVGFQWDRGE